MTSTHCPDCYAPVPPRRRGQDARCGTCRAEVGQRRTRSADRGRRVRDLGDGMGA